MKKIILLCFFIFLDPWPTSIIINFPESGSDALTLVINNKKHNNKINIIFFILNYI